MGTNTATLAVVQIGDEEAFHLMNTALGTVNLTKAALNALFMVNYRDECPPGSGLGNLRAARINQLACLNFH
jgi:hypothetical protein